MVILHIPVTSAEVLFNGEKRKVLKFTEGFWRAEKVGQEFGEPVIFTNLLREGLALLDSANTFPDLTPNSVYFVLEPQPPQNVGTDDEQPSLHNDLVPVF